MAGKVENGTDGAGMPAWVMLSRILAGFLFIIIGFFMNNATTLIALLFGMVLLLFANSDISSFDFTSGSTKLVISSMQRALNNLTAKTNAQAKQGQGAIPAEGPASAEGIELTARPSTPGRTGL